MAFKVAPAALALASVLALGPLEPSLAAAACSHDVFAIEGTSLTVELCAEPHARAGGKPAPVTLTATFGVRGRPPYVRSLPLDVVGSAEASRTIDDAPLGTLGIAKTLHLTIAYKPGSVRLEHALLVPGAIALK